MKTIKCLLLSAFILALLAGCSKDDNGNPEFPLKVSDHLDDLDYRLYSLVLDGLFPETENLVVAQVTQAVSGSPGREYMQSMKEAFPEMDTTVFSGYIQVNDTVFYFENKFSVASKRVFLISPEEIRYIFNYEEINRGWEEFYRRYPNSSGTISFSRIGYNTEKTQAMIIMGNMYGSLGGEGRLIFLKFENNEWKITFSMLTWIS